MSFVVHPATGRIIVGYAEDVRTIDEKQEKIEKWKTSSWLEFCKTVMQQDTRYSLMPMSDAFGDRPAGRRGAFGPMCLRRDGELADIYIVPSSPMLGISVNAGSKFTKMQMNCFPSKTMVWPVLRIADELERQFSREVGIERNKHASPPMSQKRGGNSESSNGTLDWMAYSHGLSAYLKSNRRQSYVDLNRGSHHQVRRGR